jgi:hypothetical protein
MENDMPYFICNHQGNSYLESEFSLFAKPQKLQYLILDTSGLLPTVLHNARAFSSYADAFNCYMSCIDQGQQVQLVKYEEYPE